MHHRKQRQGLVLADAWQDRERKLLQVQLILIQVVFLVLYKGEGAAKPEDQKKGVSLENVM